MVNVVFLKRIAEDGSLDITFCRDDGFRHEYTIYVALPSSPTVEDSATIALNIEMQFSFVNPRNVTISASTYDETSDDDISKAFLLYSLAY